MRSLLLFFSLFFLIPVLKSQPQNDQCDQAFFLEDVGNWCSEISEFFTLGADGTTGLNSSCQTVNTPDVWFSFLPTTGSISIVVLSNPVNSSPLFGPVITLYEGDCSNPTEVACEGSPPFLTANQLFYDDLTLGQLYYIRIQGAAGAVQGSFQLCLNSFNQPAAPSPDCPDAAVLCDKSSFVVPKVFGGGVDPTEADDAPCLSGFSNVESSSTWYVWTAANDGSLTFRLTPLNTTDDIDFVVYEFPNGPGDCTDKIPIRCMASSCDGPTGLNESSTDVAEPPNCSLPTQDNFLAALNMVNGTTYGVMINNFSNSEIGFEMSFGGTGEFAGPQTSIISSAGNTACASELITFTELIYYPYDQIVDWEWNFGSNASMSNAFEPGPHEVSFNQVGSQLISLSITTAEGCIITRTIEIEIRCCEGNFTITPNIQATSCADSEDGSVSLTIDNPGGPPYSIVWSNNETGEMANNLASGPYIVTITDGADCDTIINIEVPSPLPFTYDTLLTLPSCDGGMDGAITLNATGGNPPLLYSWEGTPFSSGNTLNNLSNGIYSVVIQDQNICFDTLQILLQELQLELSPNVSAIQPPSCTGDSDAQITVEIANGLSPYLYDFNNGNGYVSENFLSQLTSGTYTVNVIDENLCEGNFSFTIEDPAPLGADLMETPISCFGESDGSISALPFGGTGGYDLIWETGTGTLSINQLSAGNYALTVTDANDCTFETSYNLTEPALLELFVNSFNNLICFGDADGSIELSALGGIPPYNYAINNGAEQSDPIFQNLPVGSYELNVTDDRGCKAFISSTLTAPDSIWININPVPEIILGYTTPVTTQASQSGLEYSWIYDDSLSCLNCPNPVAMPITSNWATVVVMDENGCTALDSALIRVSPERPIYIPNAFSPNDDGRNDFFQLYGGPAVKRVISLSIYDRWGGMIYEAENLSGSSDVLKWTGLVQNQPATTGVYTFIAEVEFIDRFRKIFSGDIHLVR